VSFGLGEFYALACALAWAVAVIFMRKSGESLAPLPLNLFKMLLALALFVPTLLALEGPDWPAMSTSALALTFVSGFLGIAVGDTLYYRALNAIGASRIAIAQTLYSPCVILLSVAFLGERLSVVQVLGVALVLAGIGLVSRAGGPAAEGQGDIGRGVLYAALSVFTMAAGIVIAKPLLEQHAFLWVVTLRIVGGLLGMGLYLAWQNEWRALWQAYRGVRHWPHILAGTVTGAYLSMMLWLAGYKYTQASIAAILNEMAAVFILILAAIFLQDRLRPRQWAGSAAAAAGVVLVVWR